MSKLTESVLLFAVKMTISVVATVVFLIPAEIVVAAYVFLNPDGFWQRLTIGAIGLIVMGGLQAILLVILAILLFKVWADM
jgi:hypothetical protein